MKQLLITALALFWISGNAQITEIPVRYYLSTPDYLNKRYLLILIFGVITLPAFSQIDFSKFNLDSFKLPDINRRALTGTGSLFGEYRGLNHESFPNSRLHYFSPNASLDYDHFRNTPEIQYYKSISFDQRFSTRDFNTSSNNESSSIDIYTSLFYSGYTRRYKDRSFFETGLFGSATYTYERDKLLSTIDTTDREEENISIHLQPVIGFGKGRIEPVSDVAMAMFILKDAEELGLDLSLVTTEDIHAFAGLMAEVSNRRIFDSRRLRIVELRELYSFMLSKGWVLPDDPGFFTVLTDNWNYTNVFNRLSGKRWTYLLSPEIIYSRHNPAFQSFDREEYGLDLIVDFQKRKSVSLYRSDTRIHRATLRLADNQANLFSQSPHGTYGQLTLENTIGRSWYPNNRTNVFASLSLDYSYYRFFDVISINDDQHVIRPGASIQGHYFLSYRTSLNFGAQLQYGYSSGGVLVPVVDGLQSSILSTGFNASVNASLTFAIF